VICSRPSCGLEITSAQEARERVYIAASSSSVFSKRMHDACAAAWEAERPGIRPAAPDDLRLLLSPASARTRMMADRALLGSRRRTARLAHDFRRRGRVQAT